MTVEPMAGQSVMHETFVMERRYDAEPGRVFAALADPEARQRWAAPAPDQAIEYEEADFRIGGRDLSRCGPIGDLRYRVEARYLDIVPDRRIVFSETIGTGELRYSVSLISVTLAPAGPGTHLTLTVQIASLDGADMAPGCKAGLSAALDNLAVELNRSERTAKGG